MGSTGDVARGVSNADAGILLYTNINDSGLLDLEERIK